MELSQSLIVSLLQSQNDFPVDFDDAWQWVGYSRKSDAKKVLEASFDEGSDFCGDLRKNNLRGRPLEKIFLTVDCFKSFCMMAGTTKGKDVRRYFLNCESELKRRIAEEKQNSKDRIVKALVSESHTSWQKRFDDNFFKEAYRVTGWSQPDKGHPSCMGGLIKESVYEYFPDGVTDELNRVNPRKNVGEAANIINT